MIRRSGRHPHAQGVVVRLTSAALEDLERFQRKGDPQVIRWALKKCLLLERNPEAGEVLSGPLVGYRKIVVGDRDWRLVWRVTHDDAGAVLVDVAEVWAFGAREDSAVYEEMKQRTAALGDSPQSIPLAEALAKLGKVAYGLEAAHEPASAEEVPEWLVHTLVNVVKMPEKEVLRLSPEQASEIWEAYISRAKEPPRGSQ